MNFSLEQFQSALKEYDTQCGGPRESAADILWYCYCVATPRDDGLIPMAEGRLESVMEALSPQASDRLFDLISEVYLSYQRAAFLDGLRCGAQLWQQLS